MFKAFVAAGAVSKANADDPKKSSLIRCARTDKGVHAAANLISVKLIIEDQNILGKINQNLSPQIRVFGIERTNGTFSAYQFCDSRIYEYLIPTHVFTPPHPKSFLGTKLAELAEEANDIEEFTTRQREVSTFWEDVEDRYIKAILEKLDRSTRSLVMKAFFELDGENTEYNGQVPSVESKASFKDGISVTAKDAEANSGDIGTVNIDSLNQHGRVNERLEEDEDSILATPKCDGPLVNSEDGANDGTHPMVENIKPETGQQDQSSVEPIVKQLRSALIAAKKAYRIHPERLSRVRSVLSGFVGPHNFHNYTVNKSPTDASANRVIKTFVVHKDPIIINDTEWLSLKVHGQSFMMHQIRKMVTMAALVVRCGCPEERLRNSFMRNKIVIPKAPSLGLLLERPVFDTYNQRFAGQHEKLDFVKYEAEMEEFKQREIYERIFREEERDHQFVHLPAIIQKHFYLEGLQADQKVPVSQRFHVFFNSIDQLKTSQLLYLSSVGIPAINRNLAKTDSSAFTAGTSINNVNELPFEDEDEDENLEPENE